MERGTYFLVIEEKKMENRTCSIQTEMVELKECLGQTRKERDEFSNALANEVAQKANFIEQVEKSKKTLQKRVEELNMVASRACASADVPVIKALGERNNAREERNMMKRQRDEAIKHARGNAALSSEVATKFHVSLEKAIRERNEARQLHDEKCLTCLHYIGVAHVIKHRDELEEKIIAMQQRLNQEVKTANRERDEARKEIVALQAERNEFKDSSNSQRRHNILLQSQRDDMNVKIETYSQTSALKESAINSQEETIKSLREQNNAQTKLLGLITAERDELRAAAIKGPTRDVAYAKGFNRVINLFDREEVVGAVFPDLFNDWYAKQPPCGNKDDLESSFLRGCQDAVNEANYPAQAFPLPDIGADSAFRSLCQDAANEAARATEEI